MTHSKLELVSELSPTPPDDAASRRKRASKTTNAALAQELVRASEVMVAATLGVMRTAHTIRAGKLSAAIRALESSLDTMRRVDHALDLVLRQIEQQVRPC
jgi:hypothetical protein